MIAESQVECAEIRAKLDARLRELAEEIHKIRIQRNALADIFFLPDELLFKIILEYALGMDAFSGKWVNIMFVCRKFRDIVLGHAQFWSYISDWTFRRMDYHDWIERSAGSLLTCKIRSTHPILATDFLRTNAHRIRSLELTGPLAGKDDVFEEVNELPVIEVLEIKVVLDEYRHALPQFLQDGRAPRLRAVRLENIRITQWNFLRNLTELDLRQSFQFRNDIPPVEDLLAVLVRCPRLRTLCLIEYLPYDKFGSLSFPQPPIDLPNLEYIFIIAFVDAIDCLLRCIHIPPTAALSLVASGVHCGPDIASLLVPIRRHFLQPGAPTLRSLNIHGTGISYLAVTADTTSSCEDDLTRTVTQHPPAPLSISVHPSTQHAMRSIFRKVLNALPLSTVADLSLTLVLERHISSVTWKTVFRHIPRLEVVRIGVNPGMIEVLTGLIAAVESGEQGLWGKRRRQAQQGMFSWPSRLELLAIVDSNRNGPVDAEQTERYDTLERLLTAYRDIDAPFKPAGELWGTLDVQKIMQGYLHVHRYRERLFAVVDNFLMEGQSWDPVSDRKQRKRDRREMKALSIKYGWDIPLDSDLSSDSSPPTPDSEGE